MGRKTGEGRRGREGGAIILMGGEKSRSRGEGWIQKGGEGHY